MMMQTFFRGMAKNKSLTAINLTGLALGFACCILIFLFLNDQLAYDVYNTKLNRIYRVNSRFVTGGSVDHIAISPAQLPEIAKDFPEVEECIRFNNGDNDHVKYKGNIFQEHDIYSADRKVFRIFSYDMIKGNPETALASPNNVVLTESIAKKYFGDEEPIEKILTIGKKDYQVSAIIRDLPLNSDLYFSMLLGMDSVSDKEDLYDFSYYTFVLFSEESMKDPGLVSNFEKKLQKFVAGPINAKTKEENVDMQISLHTQPLKGLHFEKALQYDTPKGNQNYVYIFISVAVLILFIACINYINFSIIQSMERSREVGIRKVVGSSVRQLIMRYLSQSLVLTFFGLLLSLAIVALLLPAFNNIVSRDFSFADLLNPLMIVGIFFVMIITGILAGIYPAFYSASMKIVNALKGQVSSPAGRSVRKISVTIQFALTLGLLVSTVVIYSQMSFIRDYDLGFQQKNVMILQTPNDSAHYESIKGLKDELLTHQFVSNVSLSGWGGVPADRDNEQKGSLTLLNEGKEEVRMVDNAYIDDEYFSTLNVEFALGRNYEKGSISDMENSIIVNEALVQMMRWKDPLSEKVKWGKERNIIGVIRNIHYQPLYNPVQPQIFISHRNEINSVIISIKTGAKADIAQLKNIWTKYLPDEPFVYSSLDDNLDKQYRQEEVVAKILTYFSVLTIIISVLGLFGLSLLSVYQRRKEVGIRKVIGAEFKDIALLFSKEYFLLIAISLVLISPISWYLMNEWLTTFVSHISMNVVIYIVVGSLFSVLALASVLLSIRKIASGKGVELIR